MVYKKPPLGVEPRWSWETRRLNDLGEAIKRYIEAYMPVPIEWMQEYNELVVKEEKNEAR